MKTFLSNANFNYSYLQIECIFLKIQTIKTKIFPEIPVRICENFITDCRKRLYCYKQFFGEIHVLQDGTWSSFIRRKYINKSKITTSILHYFALLFDESNG